MVGSLLLWSYQRVTVRLWSDYGQIMVRLWSDYGLWSYQPVMVRLWSDYGHMAFIMVRSAYYGQIMARLYGHFGSSPAEPAVAQQAPARPLGRPSPPGGCCCRCFSCRRCASLHLPRLGPACGFGHASLLLEVEGRCALIMQRHLDQWEDHPGIWRKIIIHLLASFCGLCAYMCSGCGWRAAYVCMWSAHSHTCKQCCPPPPRTGASIAMAARGLEPN